MTAIPKPRRTVALNLQGSYILVTISEFRLRHDSNGFSAGYVLLKPGRMTCSFMSTYEEDKMITEPETNSAPASNPACSEALFPKYNYGMERVLVVEDDRAVQRALKRLFEAKGYGVDVAGSGTAALEMFQSAPPAGGLRGPRPPCASGQ